MNAAIKEIDELRNKIELYRKDLSKNEMLVRYTLIDPFLRLLGWDTANPSQILPEYSTGSGRADYAMIDTEGNIIAFVGAKKLGAAEDLNQHISYCIASAVSYFIATDGNVWEFYDAFKKVHIPEKRIERWVIIDEKPGEIIKKSLIISNFSEFGVYNNKTKVEMKKDNIEANQFPKRETFLEAQKKEKRSSPVRPIDLLISGESIHVSKVR